MVALSASTSFPGSHLFPSLGAVTRSKGRDQPNTQGLICSRPLVLLLAPRDGTNPFPGFHFFPSLGAVARSKGQDQPISRVSFLPVPWCCRSLQGTGQTPFPGSHFFPSLGAVARSKGRDKPHFQGLISSRPLVLSLAPRDGTNPISRASFLPVPWCSLSLQGTGRDETFERG